MLPTVLAAGATATQSKCAEYLPNLGTVYSSPTPIPAFLEIVAKVQTARDSLEMLWML